MNSPDDAALAEKILGLCLGLTGLLTFSLGLVLPAALQERQSQAFFEDRLLLLVVCAVIGLATIVSCVAFLRWIGWGVPRRVLIGSFLCLLIGIFLLLAGLPVYIVFF